MEYEEENEFIFSKFLNKMKIHSNLLLNVNESE
jgi:hypothetical protein